MARVTKPCPACKTTEYPRAADGICSECERTIAWAKMRREDDAKKNGEEISVVTKEVHYALPRYFVSHGRVQDNTDQLLSRALHALIMTMVRKGGRHDATMRVPEPPKDNMGNSIHDWKMYVVMRKDQAEAVNALDKAMREFTTELADDAYNEGRNLLLSIASGDMSINELNEKHTKKD